MYISLNWLKDFVKIPAKINAASIANELTAHTVEVEGYISQADKFDKVVIGKVLEVKKHPNADRLRLTKIDVKKEKLDIVCGAPNIAEGQLVPVAMIGAKLPNGLEIKESEIRGEKSCGMVCAEDELGLGQNHEGIMVLKESAKIGENFSKYIKADDVVLEIDNKSLSNRPDLLNHYGIAREIAAIFDLPFKDYEKNLPKKAIITPEAPPLDIKINDKNGLCQRYMALKISGLKVAESPAWLKERLVAIGEKPINNIVDLSNYVMFDCGQPLHAFDADKVKSLQLREAKTEESIETIDEKERRLALGDILIADKNAPLAIAGIMGGKNSAINQETKAIILESACFSSAAIRKTSQRLGLRTEASLRFEKSLDPELPATAIYRFLNLLLEIQPALKIESQIFDYYPKKKEELSINLDFSWLDRKIGIAVSKDMVIKNLNKLGFKTKENEDGASCLVSVPSWRASKDVSCREDLAEEILRLYGYDNVPAKLPVLPLQLPLKNEERSLEWKIKDILSLALAYNEAYNYSFVNEDQLHKLNIDSSNHLRLANPLSDIHTLLRQSLVPGLVSNVKNNQAKSERLAFFEIGGVFFKTPGALKKDALSDEFLPHQEKRLSLALAGDGDVFRQLKGAVSFLLQSLGGLKEEVEFLKMENTNPWADRQLSAGIKIGGEYLGSLAVISDEAKKQNGLKKEAAFAELSLSKILMIASRSDNQYQEIGRYPAVIRDLSFVIDNKILYNDFKEEISNFNPLIRDVELFDVYAGDHLPSDKKSLAFRISYQSDERTLSAGETDEVQAKLIKHLEEKFSASLRD
jgi:phenylalanyl-tRNA synthetase beta chain